MNELYELLKEYLRIHPEAKDDDETIIFQLNHIKLTIGVIKESLKGECIACKYRYNDIESLSCRDCLYNNTGLKNSINFEFYIN